MGTHIHVHTHMCVPVYLNWCAGTFVCGVDDDMSDNEEVEVCNVCMHVYDVCNVHACMSEKEREPPVCLQSDLI